MSNFLFRSNIIIGGNMLKSTTNLALMLIVVLSSFLFSCKDDDSSTNPANCGQVTAKVSGAITLDYSGCNPIFTKLQVTEYIQRTLVTTMAYNGKTYLLLLSINDKGNGKGAYKIEDGEAQASFSIESDPNNAFVMYPEGEITLTEVTDNSWVGSFHFDIMNGLDSSKVKIIEGKINAKK